MGRGGGTPCIFKRDTVLLENANPGPVRFEWAVKLSVLLPAIHLNLTTPCPDPGLACHLQGEQRPSSLPTGAPRHVCTPVTSWVAEEEASSAPVPPVSDLSPVRLLLPSELLTLLSPQPGASQAPPVPLSSHDSLSLSFHSQASRKACLHSLSSFLTSNFLFNPLLPDLFCSIERLSLR
ncbi:Hypothetical predicted protein [Lynx pardinus]|uniref:Uncharacterized protein n=1 Tax=Lynx pardinus TaxID=191816 RepID=A0A485MZN6_LYNPA|nr:Hypothetical predicted protein [Lynx pardinus]